MFGGGVSVSVIQDNKANETEGFMDNKDEVERLFGTGNIGPDRIRLSTKYAPRNPQQSLNDSKIVTLDNQDQFEMMAGEFKIERGFMTLDQVSIWSVINPLKHKSGDYTVYTVLGMDR